MQAPAPTTHIRPCRCAVAGATRSNAAMADSRNSSVSPKKKTSSLVVPSPVAPGSSRSFTTADHTPKRRSQVSKGESNCLHQ